MSSLIDIKHPYQIKDVKSIDEYLFILKNILRTASKKNLTEKPPGFNIPVRWSSLNKSFVVDFGTNKQRDISGVNLTNLSFYFNEGTDIFNSIIFLFNKIKNSINHETVFERYKLKKNENRFFNFVVNQKTIYLTGLYNRCQSKKRSGIYSPSNKKSLLIDNSIDFLLNVQKNLSFITIPNIYKMQESYSSLYLQFLDELNSLKITLKKDQNTEFFVSLKDVPNNSKHIKISLKKYIQILNHELFIDSTDLLWFFVYHVTLLFNHKVIKSLNRKNVENFLLYDNISNEFIKIVKKYNVEKIDEDKIKKETFYPPLMPVSF
jgi:hypothetical protein